MHIAPELVTRLVVCPEDPREHIARYNLDQTLCGKNVLAEITLRGRLAPCPDCRLRVEMKEAR